MIAALFRPILPYLLAGAAAVAALCALLVGAKRQGKMNEVAARLGEQAANMRVARDAERSMDRRPDGDAARELRDRWSRD